MPCSQQDPEINREIGFPAWIAFEICGVILDREAGFHAKHVSKWDADPHTVTMSASAKRTPEMESLTGRFLKNGSHLSMALPIHRMGWGSQTGSPIARSSRRAAGIIYHGKKDAITDLVKFELVCYEGRKLKSPPQRAFR